MMNHRKNKERGGGGREDVQSTRKHKKTVRESKEGVRDGCVCVKTYILEYEKSQPTKGKDGSKCQTSATSVCIRMTTS